MGNKIGAIAVIALLLQICLIQVHLISHQTPPWGKAQPRAVLQRLPVMDLIALKNTSPKSYSQRAQCSYLGLKAFAHLPVATHPLTTGCQAVGDEPPCAVLMRWMARHELQQPQTVSCMTTSICPCCSETSGAGGAF